MRRVLPFPWSGFLVTLPLLAGAELHLTTPLNYQVVQRDTPAGGALPIAGEVSDAFQPGDRLEARLVGAQVVNDWTHFLTPLPDQRSFRGELDAPAGGWFTLEVRLKRANQVLAQRQVDQVGVGEVFVVAGQSNAANYGAERQMVKSGRVATFSGTDWRIADDPQPGASGKGGSFLPPFAELMADRFGVPVGLLAVGEGGTSVREWLPRGVGFPNPPTVTERVTQTGTGEWESTGELFERLVNRMGSAGPAGFRALLWHQGESDANQRDPSRTLPGDQYQRYLTRLIVEARRAVGWDMPWFVAQASYHAPDDPGSSEIRNAQAATWRSGVALAGPDTDALTGEWRDNDGKGVHFSSRGLREHGRMWADRLSPWLERQLSTGTPARPYIAGSTPRLVLPGAEYFYIDGRPAFVFLPPPAKRPALQPWIFYAPTLPGYPDEAERWMHQRFLEAGIAIAGVDVGEAYGSPRAQPVFDALWNELVDARGFASQPCLFGRSRGGLWVSSWAAARPNRIAGLVGIYPVFDLRSYPGLPAAAPAYGLSPLELEQQLDELNPVARLGILAAAAIPSFLVHGDRDKVVPLPANSGEFLRRYQLAGAGSLVNLEVVPGEGHNFFPGYFHSSNLVAFAIARARAGAGQLGPANEQSSRP